MNKKWLIKSEPDAYSWNDFEKQGKSVWDGVRNYQARNNLKLMKKGDFALFYHSNIGLEIVGIAEVSKEFFQDPTTEDVRWVAVEFVPKLKLPTSVSLKELKLDARLENMLFLRQSRLSVSPISEIEFNIILSKANLTQF